MCFYAVDVKFNLSQDLALHLLPSQHQPLMAPSLPLCPSWPQWVTFRQSFTQTYSQAGSVQHDHTATQHHAMMGPKAAPGWSSLDPQDDVTLTGHAVKGHHTMS
jgi:hypothetical protein